MVDTNGVGLTRINSGIPTKTPQTTRALRAQLGKSMTIILKDLMYSKAQEERMKTAEGRETAKRRRREQQNRKRRHSRPQVLRITEELPRITLRTQEHW